MYTITVDDKDLYIPDSEDYQVSSANISVNTDSVAYLDMEVPSTNKGLKEIKQQASIVKVYENDIMRYKLFVDKIDYDFEGTASVHATSVLAYLNDSLVRPYSTIDSEEGLTAPSSVNGYFNWLIEQHNKNIKDTKKTFYVGVNQGASLDHNNYIYRSSKEVPTTSDEIRNKILDSYGAYITLTFNGDQNIINLYADVHDANEQVIDFGVNLLDLTKTVSTEDSYTVVRPSGAVPETDNHSTSLPITISSIPDGISKWDSDVYKSGDTVYSISGVKKYGYKEYEYSNTDVSSVEYLYQLAVSTIKKLVNPYLTIEVKAVDLALLYMEKYRPMEVGQSVRVRSEPRGVDEYLRISEISIDLLDPSQDSYTLGESYDSLTGQQSGYMQKLNSNINKSFDIVGSSADAANKLANIAKKNADEADKKAEQAKTDASAASTKANEANAKADTATDTANSANAKANEAKADAANASSKADEANTKADTAKANAATAQSTADTATDTANSANAKANEAKADAANASSKADEANTKADAAKANAATAQSTADTAKANAATAQSTADIAKANADTAQATADTANSTANAAKTSANTLETLIRQSGDGVEVAKKVNGEYTSTKTLMGSDGFYVEDENGDKLTQILSNKVVLGKENTTHVHITPEVFSFVDNKEEAVAQFYDGGMRVNRNSFNLHTSNASDGKTTYNYIDTKGDFWIQSKIDTKKYPSINPINRSTIHSNMIYSELDEDIVSQLSLSCCAYINPNSNDNTPVANIRLSSYDTSANNIAANSSIELSATAIIINNKSLEDFVIAQGTSGVWYYRKWKSGRAECWNNFTHNSGTWNWWNSNSYVKYGTNKIPDKALPFKFTSVLYHTTVAGSPSNGFGRGCWTTNERVNNEGTTLLGGYVVAPDGNAIDANPIVILQYVIGTWK